MQSMFTNLFSRRQAPSDPKAIVDRRSGAPVRRQPAPMPRMRWYS